jgi:hypothetical protein
MFKVSPTSLQTFTDTPNCVLEDRIQSSTVRIPNVFCHDHLQLINFVLNHQVNRDFLINLYNIFLIASDLRSFTTNITPA